MPLAAVVAVATVASHVQGQNAARAQGDIAEAKERQERSDRDKALGFAEATPDELKQLNQSIALNEGDIARKQKLLDSSDPALIEAGKQALQLLRGEEAKTLGPLKNNIAKQESALREKLQAQLGSGYENTTAGIQALQAFNEQANGAIAGAQDNALGRLLGVAQDSSARYGMQSNIQNSNGLAGMFGNIQNRKISAINGTQINNAGSQFVGGLQEARNNQQTIGNAINLGSTLYSGGAFSGGGGTSPTASSNPYTLNSGAQITVPQYSLK